MTFRKFDKGASERPEDVKGDCQVRALATATGMGWMEAWEVLYDVQGARKMCHLPLVECLREHDDPDVRRTLRSEFKVIRQIDFPAKRGNKRMTGKEFCHKYPKGRFILRLAHHVVAVKDGFFYDLVDCTDSCVYTAWEVSAAFDV